MIFLFFLDHPRVQIIWPKRLILVRHSVNLSCSYDSNPLDAGILWMTSNNRMSSGNHISTTKARKSETNLTELEVMTIDDFQGFYNKNTLMLENVSRSDAGEYTCNVTNTVGSPNDTVVLVVQGINTNKILDENLCPICLICFVIVTVCIYLQKSGLHIFESIFISIICLRLTGIRYFGMTCVYPSSDINVNDNASF